MGQSSEQFQISISFSSRQIPCNTWNWTTTSHHFPGAGPHVGAHLMMLAAGNRWLRASPLSVLPCCGPNFKRLSPRSRTHDPQPPCTDHTHRDELGPVPNTCITPCSPGMLVWRKMAIPQEASERSWKQQPYQNGLRAQWVARFRSNDGKDAEQPTIQHKFHSCKTVQADARNLGSGITAKVSCEEHSDHYRYAHVHEWVVHPEHQRTRAVVKVYWIFMFYLQCPFPQFD